MAHFQRPHHQRIEQVLKSLNPEILEKAQCFFAGGTAISLQLNEYRESVDIDFLCASVEGYRLLRNIGVYDQNLGELFTTPITYMREVRRDQYGIRTVLGVEGVPIKFEIVSEGRIAIDGKHHPQLGVPTLNTESLFAEKLLANADRWADASVLSRDMIDVGFMLRNWGDIPRSAWDKALSVYGQSVLDSWSAALKKMHNPQYFLKCLKGMDIDQTEGQHILRALNDQPLPTPQPRAKL